MALTGNALQKTHSADPAEFFAQAKALLLHYPNETTQRLGVVLVML
jgi:hypothetical protein